MPRIGGIFVTGTDTGVGKTIVAAGLALGMKRRGWQVGVMKPIQTGAAERGGERGELYSPDAEFIQAALAGGGKLKDSPGEPEAGVAHSPFPFNPHTPYVLREPLAPLVCARLEGLEIEPERIIKASQWMEEHYSYLVIEGAGGVLVPICRNYFMIDLIKELGFPVVVVARASLGTINHTLLTLEALRSRQIKVLGVVLNQPTPSQSGICEQTNPEVIQSLGQVDLLGVLPHSPAISLEKGEVGNLEELVQKHLDLEPLIRALERPSSPLPYLQRRRSALLKELDRRYLWHPFTQMQEWTRGEDLLVIERGDGVYLEDSDGRRYIDGVASLWTNVHGHRKREIDQAIEDQLTRIGHSTLLGLTHAPAIELAERLIKIAPAGLSRVFYSDNGATACEIALKMAFQYWQQQGEVERASFVYFENSYHGDTLGAVSVGGIDLFHRLYKPLLFQAVRSPSPYCYRCPHQLDPLSCGLRCLDDLERIFKKQADRICALIIEPCVQGAGGMLVAPSGFLRRVRDLCDQYQVLMIADEVAVGFGRTGKMFACEHEDVQPDILCLAKGITGGYLPLAATLTTERIYAGFLGDYSQKRTFFHGHTYTGNPLACRAALANLDIFDRERVIERVQERSRQLAEGLGRLWELEHVGDIRQKGLLAGIELVRDKSSRDAYKFEEKIGIRVIQKARTMGVILRPLGDVIVLMPPLSISARELDELVSVTFEAIRQVTEG